MNFWVTINWGGPGVVGKRVRKVVGYSLIITGELLASSGGWPVGPISRLSMAHCIRELVLSLFPLIESFSFLA